LQNGAVYFHYAPGRDVIDVVNNRPRAAHSIYFEVLGDLGFIGFSIYIALLVTGFRNARWIARETRGRPELEWMGDLGRMIQVSMIAFCVSGAALSMAFYDYFLSLLIVLSAVRQMAVVALGERRATSARRARRTAKTERGDSAEPDDAAERAGEAVDTTAIARIWQKAAAAEVTGLARSPRRAVVAK